MPYRDDLEAMRARAVAAEDAVARMKSVLADSARALDEAADGRSFVGIQGAVIAVDRRSGEIAWESFLAGDSTVLVVWENGVLIASTRGEISRLDPSSGRVIWQNRLPGLGRGLPSLWLGSLGALFVGLRGHTLRVAVDTGVILWQRKLSAGGWVGLALVGTDLLVTNRGEIGSLDSETGDVRWHNELPGRGRGLASFGVTSGPLARMSIEEESEQTRRASSP